MGNSCCGLPDQFGSERSPASQYAPTKRKMNYTKPTQVTRGVNIKKNPKTGLYEGVPKEWMENNDIDINVDTSKTVTTSHFSDSIRPTAIIPPKILNVIDTMPQQQSSYLPSSKVGFLQPTNTGSNRQPMAYPVTHFGR